LLNADRHSCHFVVPFRLRYGLLSFGVIPKTAVGSLNLLRRIQIQLWTCNWNECQFRSQNTKHRISKSL